MQLRKSCNVENGGKVKMRDSVFPPRWIFIIYPFYDAFCRCLFQFGATTSHFEKLLATRKSLNPHQREEEGVSTPRKQVLCVCHTLRMIFKAWLDLHPQPTPCQNPPYCVKLVVLSQQCAMLLTRTAKCIAFFLVEVINII